MILFLLTLVRTPLGEDVRLAKKFLLMSRIHVRLAACYRVPCLIGLLSRLVVQRLIHRGIQALQPAGARMRVVILGSGGKDSAYSTWWAIMRGWEVKAIATMCVTGDDSMMFQTQGVAIAGMQAASAGIPWLPILTSGCLLYTSPSPRD